MVWTPSNHLTPLEPAETLNLPGFRRTGFFFPLQKRTLLKTLKMCLSQRDLGSLVGLERLLLVATLSGLDSRACRFCLIRELAMAAAISPRSGWSHRRQSPCSECDPVSVRTRRHVLLDDSSDLLTSPQGNNDF